MSDLYDRFEIKGDTDLETLLAWLKVRGWIGVMASVPSWSTEVSPPKGLLLRPAHDPMAPVRMAVKGDTLHSDPRTKALWVTRE